MKLRPLLLFLAVVSAVNPMAAAEKSLKPDPIKWCYTTRPGVVARTKPGNDEKELVKLTRGSLQPVYEIKKTGSGDWLRIVNIDLAVMTPRSGWVKSAEVEMAEATEFPVDDKILALSGSPFLEDFIAENTAIARTILHTKSAGLVMICYMGTEVLPQTRLQLFIKPGGRFKASSYIDLPFSEMKSPLAGLEARDMLGEGDEFLVTREPYDAGPSNVGMNVLIRRLEGSAFKIVGRIPVSARNFASYPPRLDIAEPDEANIGRPGTDTKGEIEFRPRGLLTDIAWKGEIRFHALGREKPLETIPLERVWAWDGIQFSPLR